MHNTAEDWNETAVRQAMDECDNVPYLMIGSLGLGAVALAFTNYFVAGALTLGGVALSQKKQNNAIARAEFAIKHNGSAVAARGNELKEYTESVGKNAAAEQLLHAAQKGIPLNRDGWNLLEDHYGEKLDGLLEQTETEAKGHRWFEPELVPINGTTANPPETLDELATAFGETPPVQPPNAMEFLRSLTSAPLQPVILAGLPGSGKGLLAAIALSLGVKERGLRYWIFNPKNKLEEAGYWARAEKHYLKDRLQQDDQIFSDLMATLELFSYEGSRRNNQPGTYEPFVLLLEEITALIGLFTPKQKQAFKSKITALASLLRGCNMAVWLSGQSVTLEDLGFSGRSNRAMFTAIAAIGPDRTGCKNICDTLAIPFDETTLPPGRVWLTSNAVYSALVAPGNIPQYPTWEAVPNVIDLRPGVEVSEVGTSQASDIADLLASPNLTEVKIQQIRDAYKLETPNTQRCPVEQQAAHELTQIQEVHPTSEPLKIDFDLEDVLLELRPIVDYSIKQNGFIKAIDVKRNVKEFKSVSTEDIRNHFIGLANQGFGVSQGDGDFLKYSAFGGVMGCDAITG
ncbi:hypothetical protein JOY44_30045 (plasmid) [Phormidium sp. CLA17]|uniref:hypothetical protein n=1 Tax=Leptolyngbya sp. Cla-17 TaxID=2803751 RepID=UPI001491F457|nr:hypothetical protein [Leptolyngbya sp. Cla-17]MBM0745623.1 hypothetical protein [Leptolyngbya sp. Cla-17]MBM0745663.1 hypothetical protein [Leptolyngbya sp. Cla-17]